MNQIGTCAETMQPKVASERGATLEAGSARVAGGLSLSPFNPTAALGSSATRHETASPARGLTRRLRAWGAECALPVGRPHTPPAEIPGR